MDYLIRKRAIRGPNVDIHTKKQLLHQQRQQHQQQLRLRVQHNMQCTLHRTNTTITKKADRNSSFVSRKIIKKDSLNSSIKDSEVSSVGWRDSCQRGAILTFLSLETDGQWKIVTVPLEYGSHVRYLGSRAPGSSIETNQSQDNGIGNELLVSKKEKSKKRKSKKKRIKKPKKSNNLSKETGLTEVECGSGGKISQNGANNEICNGVEALLYGTKLVESPPENSSNGNYSVSSNTSVYGCTTCIDEADLSEALAPSVPQSFSDDHHVIPTAEEQNTKCEPIKCTDVFPETSDFLVLDSLSLNSNSDHNLNSEHKSTVSVEEGAANDQQNSPGCAAQEESSFPRNTLYSIVATDSHSQKTYGGKQLSQSDMLQKKAKKSKRVPLLLSGCNASSCGNLHGHIGRGSNRSIWQKVQKKNGCIHDHDSMKMNSVCSQFDNDLNEAPSPKDNRNAISCRLEPNSEIKKQTYAKVSGKMKRKSNPGSKQEFNFCRKNHQAVGDHSNQCTKVNIQHNEVCGIPMPMNGKNRQSRLHSKTNFAMSGLQKKRAESINLKSLRSSEATLDEAEQLENAYPTAFSLSDECAENRTEKSSTSCSMMHTSELLQKLSAGKLHKLVHHEGAPADHKKEASSRAVWQEWMSTGVRSPNSNALSQFCGLPMVKIDEPDGESRNQENNAEDESHCGSLGIVPAKNSSGMCMEPNMNNINCSLSKNVFQLMNLGNQAKSIVEENSDNYCDSKCFIPESENQNVSTSDINLRNILSVVNDSHRARVASEAIQLATGCPIAEFEKLLYFASPLICPSRNIIRCQTCSLGLDVRASLCQHEMPNISFGELWQWYEKHGSYGLEVRADDFEDSSRLGIDSVSFRAYFVPYLSAVQLFTKCKAPNTDDNNTVPASSAMETSEMFKTSKISTSRQLPIFPFLVPQPRSEESSLLARGNLVCSETSAVSPPEDLSVSADSSSDDMELLFEYFESEQPQRRMPLFEMIKELARGDVPSQSRAYGDAAILSSVILRDLHPRSWYSVAWYPIYRIPEGNLRAAFLTYHSLGHLIHRQPAFDCACMDVDIVSPVVGLQSYNAQGECWFRPRHTADVLNYNPAGILKERLRTLERTASLMATAVVAKGSETSVNRQPDYEFFLSRQR